MRHRFVAGAAALALGALVAIVACGGGGGDRSTGSVGGGGLELTRTTIGDPSRPSQARCRPIGNIRTADAKIRVLLDEYSLKPAKPTVKAGDVGFTADNRGKKPHELLILRNVSINSLPADEAGGLDESKLPSGSIVGRIGPFPARSTCDGVFALTPGTYVLIDDITVLRGNGVVVSDAAKGMVAELTVG